MQMSAIIHTNNEMISATPFYGFFQSSSLSFRSSWNLPKLNGRHGACMSEDKCHRLLRKNDELTKLQKVDITTTYHSKKVDNYKLTPLVNALEASAEKNSACFHFPGHNRGHAAPLSLTHLIGEKPFLHDIPAIPELDNLFAPKGAILDAQKMAAELFGAAETWFLVGGSTCGVQAAIMATCSPGDILILPRNSHISAFSGMVLSGALPKYTMPEYNSNWDISGGITPSEVERAIKELEEEGQRAAAVLIVSPTYHGICSNVATISQLCHSHNIPLIVDEAHGAHFGFHQLLPKSALCQGADLSVQSTHKVLCSLTQSSMLHMSGNLVDRDRICKCLQTLQSTSPSYLLLASLDAARSQVSEGRESIFSGAIELAAEARSLMNKIPNISVFDIMDFPNFPAMDPLRITIGTRQLGLSGYEADHILNKDFGIVPELIETQSITLAFNLGTQREHALRFISGLKHLSAISSPEKCIKGIRNCSEHLPLFDNVNMSLSPREAFFASKTKVSIEDSVSRICGELVCPYPPGVAVLIPGEIITEVALNYLLQLKRKGAVIRGVSDHLLSSLLVCEP